MIGQENPHATEQDSLTAASNFFVFSGQCGAGKTTGIKIVEHLPPEFNCAVYRKYGVQPVCADAMPGTVDSILVPPEEFRELCRRPTFRSYRLLQYDSGLDISELRECCKQNRNVVSTITDAPFTRTLPKELPDVRVIPVVIYADAVLRHDRIVNDATSVKQANYRRSHEAAMLADYADNITLYRHVILNIFGLDVLERHIKELLALYNPELSVNGIASGGELATAGKKGTY